MASTVELTPSAILESFMSLPIYYQAAIVIGLGALFAVFHLIKRAEDDGIELEATDWEEKFENMIKLPTAKIGRPDVDELLLNQSDSAGVRTIGKIKKLDKNETNIGGKALKNMLNDKEKFQELKENGKLTTEAVSYEVVEGRTRFSRIVNGLIYNIYKLVGSGSNPQAEYFDLPLDCIQVTDNGVVIKENVKVFKKNGLWQTDTIQGQQRLDQLTWLDTNQNSQEELQKLPEFYSDYNMKVAGTKNIENTKAENWRKSKKAEKKAEREGAMEE